MTTPDAIVEIDLLIKAWQVDEIAAIRDGKHARAHDCRLGIAVLSNLRTTLLERSAAA